MGISGVGGVQQFREFEFLRGVHTVSDDGTHLPMRDSFEYVDERLWRGFALAERWESIVNEYLCVRFVLEQRQHAICSLFQD